MIFEGKIREIFLDFDGILVDFHKGMCLAHDKPDPFINSQNNGNFNLDEIWGMSATEFWSVAEEEFWANLELTPEAMEILTLAEYKVGRKNVHILTSPSKNIYCESGKKLWMRKYLPDFFEDRRYIFARHKYHCARYDRLLIDDYNRNYNEFTEKGGKCFLFPRPWNTRYKESDRGLELLREFLDNV